MRHDGRVPLGFASTKGSLLVATPPLEDPNFHHTVVFMLEHNEEGAVGVVLNRPGGDEAFEELPGWEGVATPPAVIFYGGPVETDGYVAVAKVDQPNIDAWSPLDESLGTVDLSRLPEHVADRFDAVRIFRGYSGWSGGQLDQELALGGWIVVPSEPEDVFSDSPDSLWRDVLRRQGGRLAWIANAPDDLSAN